MAMLNNQRVRNATSFWKDMWYVFKNAGFLYPSSAEKKSAVQKIGLGQKGSQNSSFISMIFPLYIYIYIYIYLIGGLEHEFYDFPYMLGMIPTDELHHFSEG